MTYPTRLLLLGAGRSASALIAYLLRHAPQENWQLTIADLDPTPLVPVLVAHAAYARAVPFSTDDATHLDELVQEHHVVISMLPAFLHPAVARVCLRHRRHLATASYATPELRALDAEARAAGVTLLMECGLDPGLDHMSAMRAIHAIRARGGWLTSFKSYCGGLLAPDSEDDNPWRYKFTWNPRNVVLAGQSTAQYIENGRLRLVPYHQLFARTEPISVPGYGDFEGYPNRDSLSYRPLYGLTDIPTMLRGTLRRPGYCAAWHALVQLGLTDDSVRLGNAATLPWSEVVAGCLHALPTPHESVADQAATYLQFAPNSPEMQLLTWLGIFSPEPVGLANATPAQLLEHLLLQKWALQPHDRDMVVMQHQFEYEIAGVVYSNTASLVVLGDDATHTAMAKTVGLPLGMAVRRLATGHVAAYGIVIPTQADIYEPILHELAAAYEISFLEGVERRLTAG
ncbi:saccharopine dehydrogenase NADP-binding domain-containing protein [Hymenobacter aerilatus]|uniref:Saccharopine dehydrogenase NADP-binding domain-containing protein n=1 Tax=Hymenobacter aerilatus TaxID=2932251 RepID=A0A8T9SZG0_9BACT|nr:saccharopine dehydrogenase C-terminal domain-containing protein [Hymenobacter aerilatus]UOR07255.1 saccharopine dehydrogenase NADP-binding domain-containing protein [Hymenobacter aerilatus]